MPSLAKPRLRSRRQVEGGAKDPRTELIAAAMDELQPAGDMDKAWQTTCVRGTVRL